MTNREGEDEALASKLWRAKQWTERLEAEKKLGQLDRVTSIHLEKLKTYIEAVEQIKALERELDLNSGLPFSESAKGRTVIEALIVFGLLEANYTFSTKNAIAWLIRHGFYPDKSGSKGAYSILADRPTLFKKREWGVYSLTPKAIETGKKLTQTQSPASPCP